MKHQSGFTLIELVMVIVILGILSAIALPRFVDLQTDALAAAKKGMTGAVKSAHAIAIADTKNIPDVDTLLTYVQSEGAVVNGGSIRVFINDVAYDIPTYVSTTCAAPANGAGTDLVGCVGEIP